MEGALYVGGNGLGTGCPGDAASTMVFVADAAGGPGDRIFATGLRAQIDKSGNIAFA